MNKLDKAVFVTCLITMGWLLNDMNEIRERKQSLPELQHHIAECDAAFINLSQEQITLLETCNTDTECYDLAVSLGVPPECAE